MKVWLLLIAAFASAQSVEVISLSCQSSTKTPPMDFTCTATFSKAVPAATTLTVTIGSDNDNPTKVVMYPVPSGAKNLTFKTGTEQALKARLPGQP